MSNTERQCFKRFNGMFAIALWDERKGRLVLARDRLGKKPLYYSVLNETILFGSELKAIMAYPSFPETGGSPVAGKVSFL